MNLLTKLTILIILLVGLIVFQREAVMPFVYKVIESDLFLVDSDDMGDPEAVSNAITSSAHLQCNQHLREQFGDDYTLIFSDTSINTWSIGNHDYVVNGELTVQPKDDPSLIKKYVCRIKYVGGDIDAIDNWSLYGISGLDDL